MAKIEYDPDLFDQACEFGYRATKGMSNIGSYVSAVKSLPAPDGLSIDGLIQILSNVETLPSDSFLLLDAISSWGESLDNVQAEERLMLEETINEYEYIISELQKEQKALDDMTGYTPNRVTEQEGKALVEKIGDQKDVVDDLKKRKRELEEILGIDSSKDKKWYEELDDATKEIQADWDDTVDDYKAAFDSIGTDVASENFGAAFESSYDLYKKLDATKDQITSDVLRGVGNTVEKIFDFTTQIEAWVLMNTGYAGIAFDVADLLGSDLRGKAQEWTKSFVSTDLVDSAYDLYYDKTKAGKYIADKSYIKYDGALAEGINKATQTAVEAGVVLAASTVLSPPVGALVAAGFTGSVEGGKAVNKAYDNGATFDEATLYSAIVGGAYGAATYFGSNYFNNLISKNGAFIPTQKIGDALKVTFSSDGAKRILINTLASGTIPMTETYAEWLTWGSDSKSLYDLTEIIDRNDMLGKTAASTLSAFGLSTTGEVLGSLMQGQLLKKRFMEQYGIPEEKAYSLLDDIEYKSGDSFKKAYYDTFPDDVDPLAYSNCGGFCNSRTGKKVINLSAKSVGIEQTIETVYHEAHHAVGGLYFFPWGKVNMKYVNETMTDMLAMRMSGRPSNGYNQTAVKLLDQIEGVIDPGKGSIAMAYLNNDYNAIFDSLFKKVGDVTETYDVMEQLFNGIDAANGSDRVTQELGVSAIQAVLDSLVVS